MHAVEKKKDELVVPESSSRQGDHLSREACEAVQPPGIWAEQFESLGLRGWAINQPVLEVLLSLSAQVTGR